MGVYRNDDYFYLEIHVRCTRSPHFLLLTSHILDHPLYFLAKTQYFDVLIFLQNSHRKLYCSIVTYVALLKKQLPLFSRNTYFFYIQFQFESGIIKKFVLQAQAFSGEACDCTCKSVQTCDKSHTQIKLDYMFLLHNCLCLVKISGSIIRA